MSRGKQGIESFGFANLSHNAIADKLRYLHKPKFVRASELLWTEEQDMKCSEIELCAHDHRSVRNPEVRVRIVNVPAKRK
jgi:hypothetical protein